MSDAIVERLTRVTEASVESRLAYGGKRLYPYGENSTNAAGFCYAWNLPWLIRNSHALMDCYSRERPVGGSLLPFPPEASQARVRDF